MLGDTSESPVFDPAAIDQIRDAAGAGGAAFVAEIVQLFLDETTLSMQNLRAGSLRADWEAVRRVAHSVKSSAAALGLIRLGDACRDLELDTRKGASGPETPKLVAAVLEQFDSVIPILKGLQ